MAKYNKSLDMLIQAAALHCQGKHKEAASIFDAATKHPSIASAAAMVNTHNSKATASAISKPIVAKPAPKKAKASAWPFAEQASGAVPHTENEEYGVEPSQNDLREVQEADAEEFEDDEDEDMKKEKADLEEDFEDMGLEDEEVATARFQRALSNLSARAKK